VTALVLATMTLALPSPLHPLSPTPPLGGAPLIETEAGVLHRVDATGRVAVGVDRDGRPFSVRVLHRLVVRDKGDYVYAIPAPVVDVQAAPGSESVPGQRRGTILWSGFDPGRKVLAANARLDLAQSAPSLPIRIVPRGNRIVIENATPVRAGTFSAEALVPPLARYLDEVHTAVVKDRAIPIGTATVTTTAVPGSESIEAPVHLRGTVGGRPVDVMLGDGRPLRVSAPRGDGRVDLRVEAVPPLRLLTPPRAGTWRTARLSGRELLARANGILLRLARMRQYQAFLGNPDPRGSIATTFVYRTGVPPQPVRPPVAAVSEGGRSWTTTVLLAAGGLALLAVGTFVWARS